MGLRNEIANAQKLRSVIALKVANSQPFFTAFGSIDAAYFMPLSIADDKSIYSNLRCQW